MFGIEEIKATGFASPSQGYEADGLDFNRILIKNPPATFIMRMGGTDMAELGISGGSILVVDRSRKPRTGDYVILVHDGSFLCRAVRFLPDKAVFASGTGEFSLELTEVDIFGVVSAIIRQL
ncbi:MAG: hypothetical protein LBC77_02955 [Spirochaetaceae bacterium]|nr:hypothetical protein [Spirochaetaceae bacterium]